MRGFSLLELMIALAILTIGSAGAVTGMLAAANDLRAGQVRLHEQVLVDAALQRARLHDKALLYESAIPIAAERDMPSHQSLGEGSWKPDASVAKQGDLSVGALFIMLPDGTFGPCDASSTPACEPAPASCVDDSIPLHVFCREVVDTRTAAAFSPGAVVVPGSFVVTRWVRVVQRQRERRDTVAGAVLGREVFAQ